jgi:hypothetical protein
MALTTVTLAVVEKDGCVVLTWTPDDEPVDRWEIYRDSTLVKTLYSLGAVTWTDYEVENNVAYSYVVTGETDAVSSAAVRAVPGPRNYGVVNPLETTARYTTLSELKALLNINTADTTYDTALTQAVVAAETAIDQFLGRSYPDPSDGAIEGIPKNVSQVALSAAVAIYNNTNSPAGTGRKPRSGSGSPCGPCAQGRLPVTISTNPSPSMSAMAIAWGCENTTP